MRTRASGTYRRSGRLRSVNRVSPDRRGTCGACCVSNDCANTVTLPPTGRVKHYHEAWPNVSNNCSWSDALRASNALIIRAIRSLRA